MKRIICGLGFLCSSIITGAMLVTFIVINWLKPYIEALLDIEALWVQDEQLLSLIALCCSAVTTIAFLVGFIKLCKQAKKKPTFKFKELIKEAVAEARAIEVQHYCYIEDKAESNLDEAKKENQLKIEKFSDMIEGLEGPDKKEEP